MRGNNAGPVLKGVIVRYARVKKGAKQGKAEGRKHGEWKMGPKRKTREACGLSGSYE